MGAKVRRLSVDGHKGLRLHDREDDFELLSTRVPRNMDARTAFVVHVRADLRKRIDDACYGFLVAGDRRRRDDDGVAFLDVDRLVLAVRDAREG